MFNFLITTELIQSSCCALPVVGIADPTDRGGFLDRSGFLARGLSLDGDPLHLNRTGGRLLARKIKSALLARRKQGGLNSYFSDATRRSVGQQHQGRVTQENRVPRWRGRVT